MTFSELRAKHPRLIFDGLETEKVGSNLTIRFHIILEPNITLSSTLTFLLGTEMSDEAINLFAYQIGMVECISYWKTACPPEVLVKVGNLNQEQIDWWHDLFFHGLGEFFYKNDIDFTKKDFLNIMATGPERFFRATPIPLAGDLVLVGGGKDSAVTLEILKKSGRPMRALVLNPTRAALDNIKIAGLTDPIIIKRTIDPKLLELNASGYLNGHTPFSAYLAFLGVFVAVLHGYENVIVSNESSANEGNVLFHGSQINHQYSKSYVFEKKFREYAQKYLTNKHTYFSLLRPMNELQISKLFSQYPQYFSSFRSCNVGSKEDRWCGACAKCAFVYMSLFPFVPYEQVTAIWGSDLFIKSDIGTFIRELVGLGEQKPFECVGTEEEAKLALALSIARYESLGKEVPTPLRAIEKELKPNLSIVEKMKEIVAKGWNNEHFVPETYAKILKEEFASSTKY